MDHTKKKQSSKNDIVLITPVSKDLLYFKVADSIKSYIKLSKMQPGEKLPSERALSEQFQCGRHSIREALRILQNENIIKVKIGSGTYLANNSDSGSLYLKLVKVNYMELLSIKTELEKFAVRTIIRNGDTGQLGLLENILGKMELDADRGIFNAEADKLFHKTLNEFSGNHMLAQIIEKIIAAFDDYTGILVQSPELCIATIPFHRQILDAIRSGILELADQACDQIMQMDAQMLNKVGVSSSGHTE